MKSTLHTVLIALYVLSLPAVAGDGASISPQELYRLIKAGKAPVIVDVRTRMEYDAGHVPGALHVPFWAAWWRADSIPVSGQEPVVVYCAHGPRAGLAAWSLKMAGIPNIITLEGHMTAWRKQKLPEGHSADTESQP